MLVKKELNWLVEAGIGDIVEVEQFNNALTNDVFLVTDTMKQKFVFKRLNREARSDEDRHDELLVQQLAFQHALTPEVLAYSQDYKLQHYIEGQLVSPLQDNLCYLLSAQLQRIHQLPAQHAPKQRLFFELQRLKAQLPVKIDELRFQQMLALAQRLDNHCRYDLLCHGDLSVNNVLQGDNGQIYILDWEYAVIACAAYDLAFCYCINDFTESQRKLLIENYYQQSECKRQTLDSLQKECDLYFNIFNYINELWSICFVDNG